MSFETELLDLIGTATDTWDMVPTVRRCFLYDFLGAPVRLWDGQGVLTAGGFDWLGTIDAAGQNRHKAPGVRDDRDGSSPRLEFGVPYLDATTYAGLKASQSLARGRDLICYSVLCKAGEGLVPTTALRFNYRLAMPGAPSIRSEKVTPRMASR